MALLDHLGQKVSAEEITETNFKNGQSKRIITASDMDGTMFKNDLGPLIFLEKLADPLFWELDINEFSKILLPKKYHALLEDGVDGNIPNLRPELCALALALAEDIKNLYEHIQLIVAGRQHANGEYKLVREFARKMMELDRIFVMIDTVLSEKLNGEILMRTRFFAGKQPYAIARLTKRVMQRSPTSVDRRLNLQIEPDQNAKAPRHVSEEMINEVHGEEESPFKKIDRLVKPVDDVVEFIRHAVAERGIMGIVATGNLKAIAKAAIEQSPYRFLEEQQFRRKKPFKDPPPPLVVGTWLRSAEDGTLHPRVQGKPILGERKKVEVNKCAQERNKRLGIFLGDSVSTDGPAMLSAVNQEGVAIIVGRDIDAIRKKFAPILSRIRKHHQRKIYYSVEIE